MQSKARKIAMVASAGTLVLIGAVSIWTPFINHVYFERWFGWPTAFSSTFVPLLLALCVAALWQGLTRDKHLQPFLAALAYTGNAYWVFRGKTDPEEGYH